MCLLEGFDNNIIDVVLLEGFDYIIDLVLFKGLSALLEHSKDLSNDTGVSMLACFDHEEIGSDSAQGTTS